MLTFYMSCFDDESNEELFRKVHDKYELKMYRVAKAILHSPALAEEAVNEAFIRIIKYIQKNNEIPRHETDRWIVTIVRNTSIDIRRKETKYENLDEDLEIVSNFSVDGGSEYNRLVEIIRSMPENYRTLFELKYVLEYSNTEIAEAFGITEDAVAARIYRGRKKLLKLLEKEGFTYE